MDNIGAKRFVLLNFKSMWRKKLQAFNEVERNRIYRNNIYRNKENLIKMELKLI